jgi:hypothetical protein
MAGTGQTIVGPGKLSGRNKTLTTFLGIVTIACYRNYHYCLLQQHSCGYSAGLFKDQIEKAVFKGSAALFEHVLNRVNGGGKESSQRSFYWGLATIIVSYCLAWANYQWAWQTIRQLKQQQHCWLLQVGNNIA